MLALRNNRLYLAFPGMGKTPLSIKNGRYRDVDFGTFREGLGVSKEHENRIIPTFINYLVALDHDTIGCKFLTNEPKIASKIRINVMFLPIGDPAISYCAHKMRVKKPQILEWVSDWIDIAKYYEIPVVFVRHGLDNYLE